MFQVTDSNDAFTLHSSFDEAMAAAKALAATDPTVEMWDTNTGEVFFETEAGKVIWERAQS